jgi:Cu(I)/Ag(I) efflux system membrane fusion protein
MKRIYTQRMLLVCAAALLLGAVVVQEKAQKAANAANCADPNETVVYTCAMHPDLRSAEPGECAVCGMNLVQNVFKYYQDPNRLLLTPLGTDLAGVETARVEAGRELARELRLTGRVTPDERRVFHQIARIPGTIEKLYVNSVGQYVRKGQPIAAIYSKDLIAIMEAFEYSKNSESVVRSAENSLRSWGLDRSIVNNIDFKKGGYQKAIDLRADFSGTVLAKHVNAGDQTANVHMGGAASVMFDLADLSRVWVLFDVYESDLAWVKRGDAIRFTVPAYPGREFSARVALVDPVIDPQTRSCTVRVEVDNRGGLLKPDMLATGYLRVRERLAGPALVVPRSAVLWAGERAVVYVRDTAYSQPVFECREVALGAALGDHYQIRSGLAAGETIVTNGAFRVDAAAQLNRKNSLLHRAPASRPAEPLLSGPAEPR